MVSSAPFVLENKSLQSIKVSTDAKVPAGGNAIIPPLTPTHTHSCSLGNGSWFQPIMAPDGDMVYTLQNSKVTASLHVGSRAQGGRTEIVTLEMGLPSRIFAEGIVGDQGVLFTLIQEMPLVVRVDASDCSLNVAFRKTNAVQIKDSFFFRIGDEILHDDQDGSLRSMASMSIRLDKKESKRSRAASEKSTTRELKRMKLVEDDCDPFGDKDGIAFQLSFDEEEEEEEEDEGVGEEEEEDSDDQATKEVNPLMADGLYPDNCTSCSALLTKATCHVELDSIQDLVFMCPACAASRLSVPSSPSNQQRIAAALRFRNVAKTLTLNSPTTLIRQLSGLCEAIKNVPPGELKQGEKLSNLIHDHLEPYDASRSVV
jgi:hypothetical protein